jgi:hypothetical protein
MNAFFIKSTFMVPIKSDLNLYRLSFWVMMTYMAVFEFNWYAQGNSRRVGVNSWLAGSLVSLETVLVIKHTYQEGLFTYEQLWPADYIVTGWSATAVLCLILVAVKSTRKLIVWHVGAEEIFDTTPTPSKAKKTSSRKRSTSYDSLEKIVPGSKTLLEIGALLDVAFQILTFAIPVPLLLVFAIDCYRTTLHPSPRPGVDEGY